MGGGGPDTFLGPGWTTERCGCRGDGRFGSRRKSVWCVDSVLVATAAPWRRPTRPGVPGRVQLSTPGSTGCTRFPDESRCPLLWTVPALKPRLRPRRTGHGMQCDHEERDSLWCGHELPGRGRSLPGSGFLRRVPRYVGLDEHPQQVRIQLAALRLVEQDVVRLLLRHGALVRAVAGGQRVVDVADRHHARGQRDLRLLQRARISLAGEFLVVAVGDVRNALEGTRPGDLREEAIGVRDV